MANWISRQGEPARELREYCMAILMEKVRASPYGRLEAPLQVIVRHVQMQGYQRSQSWAGKIVKELVEQGKLYSLGNSYGHVLVGGWRWRDELAAAERALKSAKGERQRSLKCLVKWIGELGVKYDKASKKR